MKKYWMYWMAIVAITASVPSHAMTPEESQKELQKAEAASQQMESNRPVVIKEDSDCRAKWSKSSAAKTCTTTNYIEQKPVGTCMIRARCQKLSSETRDLPDWKESVNAPSWQYDQHQHTTQSFPASSGYTEELVNCDGELKYFDCK